MLLDPNHGHRCATNLTPEGRAAQVYLYQMVPPVGVEPTTLRLSGANTGYKPAALPLSYRGDK